MQSIKIVVSVYGGVVQDVFCSEPTAEVQVVDWDADIDHHADHGFVTVVDKFHRPSPAVVRRREAEPLDALEGTPIEKALKLAEELDRSSTGAVA